MIECSDRLRAFMLRDLLDMYILDEVVMRPEELGWISRRSRTYIVGFLRTAISEKYASLANVVPPKGRAPRRCSARPRSRYIRWALE